MDAQSLMHLIDELIEKLALVQTDRSSDEFLISLNKLISTATDVTLSVALQREQERLHRKRRLSYVSASSGEVAYIPSNVATVDLDSDSHESVLLVHSMTNQTTTLNNGSSIEDPTREDTLSSEVDIMTPCLNLKRMTTMPLQAMELCKKQCFVKLHRMDEPELSSTIHGVNRNIMPENNGMHSAENGQNKNKKMVSLIENENVREASLRPLGRYTYEDYLKRHRDVCFIQ